MFNATLNQQNISPYVDTPQSLIIKENVNTVEATVHDGEVLSVEFSPSGRTIASSSSDKTIRLVSVYGQNDLLILKGHKGAVIQIKWASDGDRMFSCSADYTAAVWDLISGQRIRKLIGHEGIVNSCSSRYSSPNLLVTGSDDGITKLWDLRVFRSVVDIKDRYQILSVAFDDTLHKIYSGSLNNNIAVYDIRFTISTPPSNFDSLSTILTNPLYVLIGHTNAITGLSLTSCNGILASNSMDQTVRLWNVKPYISEGASRCFSVMKGPSHNFEQYLHRVNFGPDNLTIGVGSADRHIYILSVEGVENNGNEPKLLYCLPGHNGSVTEVSLHPEEKLVASGGTDKRVILKQLN